MSGQASEQNIDINKYQYDARILPKKKLHFFRDFKAY